MTPEPSFDIFDPAVAVLEARLARFEPDEHWTAATDRINFTLRNGELMLVYHADRSRPCRLADACLGLVRPVRGQVLFRGKEWGHLLSGAGERDRARIGRVFAEPSWVSNLDLEENVLLRLRHRGVFARRQRARDAAAALARFGVESLPHSRIADAPEETLQLAQWIRAFAGEPELVILEYPVTDPSLPVDRLVAAVGEVRARGGAVLWITGREDIWRRSDLRVSQRFEVREDRLVAVAEDA